MTRAVFRQSSQRQCHLQGWPARNASGLVTIPACTSHHALPPPRPPPCDAPGMSHLCRTAWHSRAGASAVTRCMPRRAHLLVMQNPMPQGSATRTRAAQAREQGVQDLQVEPVAAPTPAPALPPWCAWTTLLRNELVSDVDNRSLSAVDGGAPCAALSCAPAPSSSHKGKQAAPCRPFSHCMVA